MLSPTKEEVKALRQEHNLTQTEFARINNYKYRMVTNWENGSYKMPGVIWESYLIYFRKREPKHFDD